MRHEHFDTPGEVLVRIENKAGDVEMRAHAAPETEVELIPSTTEAEGLVETAVVEHSRVGGRHRVLVQVPERARSGWIFQRGGVDVRVRVRVPETASIEVETTSAEVRTERRVGSARIDTASGDVAVDRVDGDLKVRTASGRVSVGSVGGDAVVQTASGDVCCESLEGGGRLNTASGEVSVGSAAAVLAISTASGDVGARDVAAGCTVKTTSGDQRISRVAAGRVQLDSVTGDLTVGVARGAVVAVDAQAVTGSLSSDIALDADEPDGEAPRLELRVRTVSGDLHIQRA